MLYLVISGLLVLAGLYVAMADGVAPGMHLFGWALLVVGVLGLVGGLLVRRSR